MKNSSEKKSRIIVVPVPPVESVQSGLHPAIIAFIQSLATTAAEEDYKHLQGALINVREAKS